jgi:hypothetical protein
MKKLLFLLLLSSSLSAQVADMRLTGQTGRPTSLPPGDFADMILALFNAGPDVARNVRVEFKATAGVRFTRLSDPRCSASGDGVLCLFGDMAPAELTYTGVEYELPFGAGSQSVTATLLTDSSDPDASNNSHTINYQVVPVPGVFVSPFPRQARVDPGQTTTFVTAVHRVTRARETDTIPAGTIVEARFAVDNGATIEAIVAPPIWSCTLGGATAACRAIAPGGDCCGELAVTVRASGDRAGGFVRLDVEAVVQRPSLDVPIRTDASIEVFRHAIVSNVQDSGPGSLRAAIAEVNEHCARHSCRLLFETSGEIVPAAPLPRIVADRILIDGAGLVLDGRVAGRGLEVHAACEATLRRLTFRNFTANEGLWFTAGRDCDYGSPWPQQFRIENNVFERNRRGLILDGARLPVVTANVIRDNQFAGIWMWRGSAWIESNRIENNGASGIFLGPDVRQTRVLSNTISGHPQMGVAVAYGASHIEIGGNRMHDNGGLGIDWGLDGITPQRDDDTLTEPNAPALLSAVYDRLTNRTHVTVTLRTRGNAVIELFADDVPVALAAAQHTDGTPFIVSVTGDHRGKWITATATRTTNDQAWTSELSNAVFVSP